MASDWVKSRDRDFCEQVNKLIAIIANHQAVWGLSHEDLLSLTECKASFDAALSEHTVTASAYHKAVGEKQVSRDRLERALRMTVRRINNHPGMTDALRQEMNLAAPTRTRTPCAPCPLRGETTKNTSD